MVSDTVLILAGLIVGLLLQQGVLKLVSRQELLAEVNERSSHVTPTPTMGGSVIVLVVLAFLLYLTPHLGLLTGGLLVATGLVAGIGLWDDIQHLDAKVRFAVHVVGAAVGLWALGVEPGFSAVLLLVGLVWLTNLYNFMDGIDGIAAVQTLTFCVGVQLATGGVPGWSGDLLWLLSGVTLAFLAYNWPPARIFMGDVGSGFLGLLIGLLVLYLWQLDILPLIGSLILLAGFWFDASYTLCVRMISGQRFTQAHRSHLYQRLATAKGHAWTTSVFLGFSLFWLWPLTLLAQLYPGWQAAALLVAILPLAAGCWYYRAGVNSAG